MREGERCGLAARKARLLLALLAAAGERGMTRHRLAGLLWESSDAVQARSSLRQALAQVRRAAGDGWTVTDGDALRLAPAVSSDVAEFLAALGRSDSAAAASLYAGGFAEGIDVGGAELAEVLGAERARFEALAREALRREIERAGERPEAASTARALLALDPLDEAAHRCLMALDAARGARGAATARFRTLVARLECELGATPAPETRALHDRLRYASGAAPARAATGQGATEPTAAERAPEPPALLIALAADGAADWEALARDAGDAGATPRPAGPGEAILAWPGAKLRAVSAAALELARSAGTALSFGLVAGGSSPEEDARAIARARRIAALAEPGSVHLEPALAVRLGLSPEPGGGATRLASTPPAGERPERPIVGRDFELAQVDAAIGAARAAGRGLAVHVGGEAGIGKSRLVAEIARRRAAEGATVATVAFEAFVRGRHLAQRLAAALPDAPADAIADGAVGTSTGADRSAFDRAVHRWLVGAAIDAETELGLSALSAEERRRRTLDALADRLRRVAGPDGALLVVEDCHWAPAGAADFLLDLCRHLAALPVAVLLTERPHEAGLDRRLGIRGGPEVLRIALAPLSETAAARLARLVAPDGPPPHEAIARSAGHPLFLIRLLESRWRAGPLPDTVAALVLEQIERLAPGQREALRRGALLGRAFDPADAAAVFPDVEPARPSGDLLHATDSGLAFGHDLVREAVYDAIPETLRREWHGRAARHFRAVDPLRWAHHALLGEDDIKACRAATAAANAMIATRQLDAAFAFIEAGLARGADPEAVAELHSCRAGVRRMCGDLAGALDDYRAAHASALADATRVAMRVGEALMLHRLGRGAEADRVLDAAEAIADRIGLGGLGRAEICEQRGNRAFARGDRAACLAHHEAGLAAAEATGDPRGIARAHGGIGDAHYAAGRPATACCHFERAIEMAEAAGLGVVREEYLFMRAFALFFTEPGQRAHALVDVAVESAIQCGAGRAERVAREVRAQMRLMADDLDGLDEDMAVLDAAVRRSGETRFDNDIDVLASWRLLRRGESTAARARLAPLLDSADDNSDNGGTILGLAVNLAEDLRERDAYLARGRARLERGALCHSTLWYHVLTLERAARDGDRALAERQWRALRAWSEGERFELADLALRAVRAALDGAGAPERKALAGELDAARLGYLARLGSGWGRGDGEGIAAYRRVGDRAGRGRGGA